MSWRNEGMKSSRGQLGVGMKGSGDGGVEEMDRELFLFNLKQHQNIVHAAFYVFTE